MRRQVRRLLIGVAAAGVFLLAGCGAGGEDSGASGSEGEAPAAQEDAAAPEAAPDADGAGEAGGDAGAGGTVRAAQVVPRHIIYTGSITVHVPDVDAAAEAATAVAERYGGFVGGDRRVAAEDARPQATLVLRVPSEEFTDAVNDLGALGEEESRELRTEDVTVEVVDLETQLETAEASVDRTRALMEQARSIDDIVRIERELSDREATLASLQARQRTLEDLTTLSTITATLLGPDPEGTGDGDGDGAGFLAGLGAGWRGFTASLTVALTVVGALLPWLVVLGIPAAALWWWARRRRVAPPPA